MSPTLAALNDDFSGPPALCTIVAGSGNLRVGRGPPAPALRIDKFRAAKYPTHQTSNRIIHVQTFPMKTGLPQKLDIVQLLHRGVLQPLNSTDRDHESSAVGEVDDNPFRSFVKANRGRDRQAGTFLRLLRA